MAAEAGAGHTLVVDRVVIGVERPGREAHGRADEEDLSFVGWPSARVEDLEVEAEGRRGELGGP